MIAACIVALLVLLALASTLSAGLGLDLAVARSPDARNTAMRALLANLLLVPAAAAALMLVAPDSDVRLAVFLVAIAPAGATGPLLALLAGGDPTRVAVSFTALAFVSLLAPLAMLFALGAPGLGPTVLGIVAVQLVPLALGALLRSRTPVRALALEPPVRRAGSVLLALVIALLLWDRGALLSTLDAASFAVLAALVLATLAAGWICARRERGALSVLTAVRNLTLVLLLAEASAPGGRVTLVVGAYGLVMYGGALAVLLTLRSRPHSTPS